MILSLHCVGADASVDGSLFSYFHKAFGSVGIKASTGVVLEFETAMFRRFFAISDPVEINREDSGLRVSMMMMKDFVVSDPPKGVVIADLNGKLADVHVINRNARLADVEISICDKLDQPNFTIEKYNVPYQGILSSEFEVRGKLVATQTFHKISDKNTRDFPKK